MEYEEWIRAQHDRGLSPEAIAQESLHRPVNSLIRNNRVEAVFSQVAALLHVAPDAIYVMGSSRFGFSLRDGSRFDPAYSDLDLAIVDKPLYLRCAGAQENTGAARFPEQDLPPAERIQVRRAFDAISRTLADLFAYVSVAVWPDNAMLVRAQAVRIRAYLAGTDHTSARSHGLVASLDAPHTDFQRIVDAGLPQYTLPIAAATPRNASPWLTNNAGFQRAFGGSALRRIRLEVLQAAFVDLKQVVDVQCCLVGGSFVDVSNAAPNDLDIVVFYRARGDVSFEPGRALQRLTRKFLLKHIDMRFVPCDAEPWLLVKLTSYFTMLYLSRRPGMEDRRHGVVLLVPDAMQS